MSRPPSVTPRASLIGVSAAMGLLAGATLVAGSAQAQSASSTASSYRTGYGGAGLSGLESPVSPSLITSGSQYSIADGVNQAGADGSLITTQTASGQPSSGQTSGGAGQSYSGVGQASTVSNERAPVAAVESTSRNATGARTAATASGPQTTSEGAPSDMVLNGKLNLDGGQ